MQPESEGPETKRDEGPGETEAVSPGAICEPAYMRGLILIGIARCIAMVLLGLKATSDNLGYFGYNSNFESYIEVISFERLLNSARERNRAFFDKLGLPTNRQ